MIQKYREFKFFETYETASWLEVAVLDPESFIEVPWDFEGVKESLGKFSKISILHYYIFILLSVEKRREYRKNFYDRGPEAIPEFKKVFEEYGICLRDETDFSPYGDDYDEYEHFCLWFEYHEDNFELLWEKITEEVFHLLFSNREFLLDFNKSLAQYLNLNPELVPCEFRSSLGKIKRSNYIPTWAKKAIYFRDQGRCVKCQSDLSGLLSTDRKIHYDHIVPLNLWGVNDPCNLQLLCEDCNLKKSGSEASTWTRYRDWW